MCNEQCFVKTMWILCCHWIASISCYLIKKREKSDSSSCSFLKIPLTRGYIQVIITKRSARAEAWNRPGELSERFKVQSWKGCVVERLPRVRISYSPPVETIPLFRGFFLSWNKTGPPILSFAWTVSGVLFCMPVRCRRTLVRTPADWKSKSPALLQTTPQFSGSSGSSVSFMIRFTTLETRKIRINARILARNRIRKNLWKSFTVSPFPLLVRQDWHKISWLSQPPAIDENSSSTEEQASPMM